MTKETNLTYTDGIAYYADIKRYLLVNNQNDFGKVSHRLNVLNPEDVVKSLDALDKDHMKKAIVAFYNLLWRSYKDAVISKRKRSINQTAKGSNSDDQPITKRIKQENNNIDSTKNTRVEYLPDYFLKCKSKSAKIAIMLYMIPSYTESIRKSIIFSIMNGHMDDKSINDLVELSRKSVGELRKVCPTMTSTEEQRKKIISALIEIGHITRDRSSAKLAFDVSQRGYITLVQNYMERFKINEMTIYEPIINKYLKECIALNNQDLERARIQNQFRTNPEQLISHLIKSLPEPKNKVDATSTKAMIFDESQSYFFYKGVPNFSQEIVVCSFEHENKIYVIETYNDCLFDVIGSFTETIDETTGAKHTTCDITLRKKTWEERLKLLPFRTKVSVGSTTGKTLNEFAGVTDVAVSWFDKNGMSCRRIVRKRDKKPS